MADSFKERISAVDLAAMTPSQSAAAQDLLSGPRGAVRGPFAVLLNSPGAFTPVQNLGAYLRYESPLPTRLRELAILVTARHWRQDYEWQAHSVIARQAGLSDAAMDAVAKGLVPDDLSEDERAVFDFCSELHIDKGVCDTNFSRAESLLGSVLVLELCAVCGYYAMLAMVMNVARNPLPSPNSVFGTQPSGRVSE